jgi:hypothetical protein
MPHSLTASKYQARIMIGVSDEIVDGMIVSGKLTRIPDIWCVRITALSLAACLQLPVELVIRELRELPERPPKFEKSDEERGLVQQTFQFQYTDTAAITKPAAKPARHHRTVWPKARPADAKTRKAPQSS